MGKQINFYLHTKDLEWFYGLLRKRNVVFIPTQYDEQKLTIIETPSLTQAEDMYLVRKCDLNKLTFRELGGVNKAWGIDIFGSAPVVELGRSDYWADRECITQGRLYYRTDYLGDPKSALIKKDETFLKWGDSLISTVRRNFVRRSEIRCYSRTFYLGPYADEWVEQNTVEYTGGALTLRRN